MENTIKNTSNGKRTKMLIIFTLVFLLIGGGYGVYWALVARYIEKTDNAYVAGNIVQITPLTSGKVISVEVNDTDYVAEGTVLARLDKADAEISLREAEAVLAQTVRQVTTLYTNDGALKSVVAQRETDLRKAEKDLSRRQSLAGTGAISNEEIEHAKDAVASARKALLTAKEQMKVNRNLIENTDPDKHPEVEKAAARLREAHLAWERTVIKAPVSGYIAKRNVQLGQWVNTGEPLMALVPLDQVWVDANFKETQLRNMRIGQPVELVSDMLGSRVKYHGTIEGFSAGTGAVFSLIPAQNATGNWIKVVQRLAVRITLDKEQLADNPLQIGLSMEAEVNTENLGGKRLTGTETEHSGNSSTQTEEDISSVIGRIITANTDRQ